MTSKIARRTLVIISTCFLFHLSTYAPAKDPNKIAGIVNDTTIPETAVLECVSSKTIRIKKKLKIFPAICVNNSPSHKKRKDFSLRARKI
jgi:hypothetical protein